MPLERTVIEGHEEKDTEKSVEIEDRSSCGSNRKKAWKSLNYYS